MSGTTGLQEANPNAAAPPNGADCQPGCPRCGSTQSWGMSSWCPGCGYYPTLDGDADSKTASIQIAPEFQTEGEVEPQSLLHAVPGWMWVALGGVVCIFLFSIGLRVYFENYGGSPASVGWTLVCSGLAAMIGAHVMSLRYAMKSDARVTLNDALIAWIAVWQPTISDLPATRRRVWSLSWGGTVFVCAIAIVGGMDLDWLLVPGEPFYKAEPGAVIGTIADAAKDQQSDAESMEEALHNLAGESPVEEFASPGEAQPQNIVTATIFGFQANRKGVPLKFLFSGITQHARQHIATISTDRLTEDELKIIVMRLHNTLVRNPATPTVYPATWVEPLVDCRLKYDSIASNGNLVNPVLVKILKRTPTDDSVRQSDTQASGSESEGLENEDATSSADSESQRQDDSGISNTR